MNITVNFAEVMTVFHSTGATRDGARGEALGKRTDKSAVVYDIWARKQLGSFVGSFTATNIPHHGTAFLRLTPKSTP
eukprot:COSAG02_NODE_10_length_59045_cov_19.973365_7_plen_77_part_00